MPDIEPSDHFLVWVVNNLTSGSVALLVTAVSSQPSSRLARSSLSHAPTCFSVPALLTWFETTIAHQKRDRPLERVGKTVPIRKAHIQQLS
jgi:hypothetical protein